MLELYQAYGDYNDMMALAEEIIVDTVMKVNGSPKVNFDGKEIDLTTPWKKIKMTDAIREYSGIDVMSMSDE